VKVLIILTWLSLPAVMYGGFTMLRFLTRSKSPLSPWQMSMFRAGHAHAGVLVLMTLLYEVFIRQTPLSTIGQIFCTIVIILGVLLQSGGFFVHMVVGSEGKASLGTGMTMLGAVILALGIIALVVGLARA
jgi:hypothetical protein